jgi:hypothetical protein
LDHDRVHNKLGLNRLHIVTLQYFHPIADKKLTAYHDWHGYESNMGKHIGKMFGEIESLDE